MPITERVALKGYKVHKELSEETTAYTTKITLDGKVIGDACNHGRGGSDLIHIDREARAEWDKIVAEWSIETGCLSMEREDSFIAELVKIASEKKFAARQFKRDPRTTTVVAVDVQPETIGNITFYNATAFHTYAAVSDERIDANLAEQYDGNPCRKYTRADV
jgi:hypothetical protein